MIKKIALIALGAICAAVSLKAQSGAISLLSLPQDVRASGMAGVLDPKRSSGNIYSSPTDILYGERNTLRVDALYGMFPSAHSGEGANMASASVGYRMGKQALMIGGRYLTLDKYDYVDASGTLRGRVRPRETTLDLAYALRLGWGLSAFARASYVESYIGQKANVLSASVGASFRQSIHLITPMSLHVMASLDNLGGKYRYGEDGGEYNLPSLLNVSASLSLLPRESLVLGARMGYYLNEEVGRTTALSLGAQYELFRGVFLRGGYMTGRGVDAFTLGAGLQLGIIGLNASYEGNSQKNFSALRLGASLSL